MRLTLLVSLLLALTLTACVQPTPTPASTGAAPTDSGGYPAVEPSNTAPAGYPAAAPSATPSDYPAPSSRHLAPLRFGGGAAAYR